MLDSLNLTVNCLHIDLEDMLKKGFNTGYGYLRPPKRIESAAELAAILIQGSQNDCYGGQSFPDFNNSFSNTVKITRSETWKDNEKVFSDANYTEAECVEKIEIILIKRVRQAMQAIVYNLNTLHSRAGSQVPFSSVNIGIPRDNDAALICQLFLEEYSKGLGKGEQPVFPNIVFLLKDGVNVDPEDPYYYLRLLAEKVSAKRMNPTFRNLDNSALLPYYNKGIIPATMGCRTDILANINGVEGPKRRGNIAPTSLNLVRVGIESKGNWDKFYKNLIKIMDTCYDTLMYRYDVLKQLKVKDLPFVAGQKLIQGSENLEMEDSIEEILKQGSFAIGFIGLAETMVAMTGHHHGEGEEYWNKAYEIIRFMRERIDFYKDKNHLNMSLYGTPAEGLSGRFIAIDKKKYGIIAGVTDKDYYSNSYHLPVKFNVSAIDKLGTEAPFHKLCNAGKISYVELDGGTVEEREVFIHRTNTYALNNTDIDYYAYNFHIRYCKSCGTDVVGSEAKCPCCNGTDIQGISRVTGKNVAPLSSNGY